VVVCGRLWYLVGATIMLYLPKKFIGIFLLFFRVFTLKTDKNEAKEPKAKRSKNDMILNFKWPFL
jgi:hypothetical protein